VGIRLLWAGFDAASAVLGKERRVSTAMIMDFIDAFLYGVALLDDMTAHTWNFGFNGSMVYLGSQYR
jgi:hypothetical protein